MKKALTASTLAIFLLSGCVFNNTSQDVIKITSNNKGESGESTVSLASVKQLLNNGQTDKALKYLQDYSDFFNKNPEYYELLGLAYTQKKSYKEALACFNKALSYNEKNYALFINIAEVYKKQKLNKKASEYLAEYVFKTNKAEEFLQMRNRLNDVAESATGTNIVGRISLSDGAETSKNQVIGIKQAFSQETEEIFANIEVINSNKSNKIRAQWNYISAKGEVIPVNYSEFSTEGTKQILLSIKSPVTGWIAGRYELAVFVNGTQTASLNFYVF